MTMAPVGQWLVIRMQVSSKAGGTASISASAFLLPSLEAEQGGTLHNAYS